jgi:hypothetical protein
MNSNDRNKVLTLADMKPPSYRKFLNSLDLPNSNDWEKLSIYLVEKKIENLH